MTINRRCRFVRKKIIILLVVMSSLIMGCSFQENVDNQQVDLNKTRSIVSNNNRNFLTSEDVEFIYYTDSFSVKKISKKDNTVENIYTIKDFVNQIVEIECFSDKLYLLTFSNKLISMSIDGTGIKELELVDIDSPSFYTYDNGLYLISNTIGNLYKLNLDDLTLEENDSAIINQYVVADGTTFIKKIENELGKVYVLSDGEEQLFSGENESVILNRMNFTDSYVFYYAFDMKGVEDFSSLKSFYLYRVDLDGGNKKLVKEVDISQNVGDVKYDNEYIYLYVNADEYMKINKETLEETNIIEQVKSFEVSEISNERFFNFTGVSFWDSKTGEEIEF